LKKEHQKEGLKKSSDGRMRYPLSERVKIYEKIASWLGRIPALCKETKDVWETLGWTFTECNCTTRDQVPL